MREIFFIHGLSLSLEPGKAISAEGGTIVQLEDDRLAASLLARRPDQCQVPDDKHKGLRRIPQSECYHPDHIAAWIAPPLSEAALIAEMERKTKLANARRMLADSQKQPGFSLDAR